jgi:hypothetical protein
VLRQRPRDFHQLTLSGLMYKVERGGCPLCCGDEVFQLTLQTREADGVGTAAADASASKPSNNASSASSGGRRKGGGGGGGGGGGEGDGGDCIGGGDSAGWAAGAGAAGLAGLCSPAPASTPRMPGDATRALPQHRLLMENWLECHCEVGPLHKL